MVTPMGTHVVPRPTIALAAQQANRSLERLRDGINRLSDAESLPTNQLESTTIVRSLLGLAELLRSTEKLVETELHRWGL